METKLLDSTHGWSGPNMFVLEQYWMVDGDEPVKICVEYRIDREAKLYSTAELVHLDETTTNSQSVVRLRSFPSQWWRRINLEHIPYEEAPQLLVDVAQELLVRFTDLIQAI